TCLPYRSVLPVLARLFAFHPELMPRNQVLLRRWLWRGSLNRSHEGTITAQRRMLRAIDEGDQHRSVQRLLREAGGQPTKPLVALGNYNFRFARSKLETLALLALQPRALDTGEVIDLARLLDSDSAPARTLFGSSTLGPLVKTLANRVVHEKLAGGVRRRFAQLRWSEPDERQLAESHGFDEEALSRLVAGDVSACLKARHDRLLNHLDTFFAARAEWWDTFDRPPISALVDRLDDEDEDDESGAVEPTATGQRG
ncbi:MAG: hypothetical protein AAGC55_01660, partial [Myxococcota bacterium]